MRPKKIAGGNALALRWLFFRDTAGHCRWEVRGSGGPIATSGNVFEDIEACIGDAREHGFTGSGLPTVTSEAVSPAGDKRRVRQTSA